MEEAHLQGNSALLAQVESLQLPVGGPVPNMEAGTIQTWKQSRRTLANLQKTQHILVPLDWIYKT